MCTLCPIVCIYFKLLYIQATHLTGAEGSFFLRKENDLHVIKQMWLNEVYEYKYAGNVFQKYNLHHGPNICRSAW